MGMPLGTLRGLDAIADGGARLTDPGWAAAPGRSSCVRQRQIELPQASVPMTLIRREIS